MKKTTAKKSVNATAKRVKSRTGSKAVKASTTSAAAGASRLRQLEAELNAVRANQAVADFSPDGIVLTANEVFLKLYGYTLDEIKGRHHSLFVDEQFRQSVEYAEFWARLKRGESQTGEYRNVQRNGSEIWLQSNYKPTSDTHGNLLKIMQFATEITETKRKQADAESQLKSIQENQAVIEFQLDGTIMTANKNFLDATGYSLGEIQGKHHAIFVDPAHKRSPDYQAFWERLGRGQSDVGQYRRIRKDGTDLWLQASYNPVFDMNRRPCRVIKYAIDITAAKEKEADAESQLKSISANQAVVEFKLDGTIVTANQNFLDATGYALAEIQGRPHSMFVDAAYKQSQEYRLFWDRLGRGQAEVGQYKRLRKDGCEVWLQASYNPIFDLSGRACKVIKYATEITEHKRQEQQMARAMEEAGKVMRAVAGGDLSQGMQGIFEGDFARLRDAVNGSVDDLRKMITETSRVMKAVAGGDLREAMQGKFDGEFGGLRDSVNVCVEHLRSTVEQIRHAMSTMTTSATEIATGNLDLSQRTEEQAASLATTAANMEEITGTVKRNADSAREANSLATGARQQAERGGNVVSSAITAMGAINEASKRIADIIGVIDDIAFQTNLLALNAAVEAARAGEQGRGFAVVASEVRNLAQRSAGAAKEIKNLIKDSVGRVEEGSRLVNESGSTLEQIMTAAKKVSDIVAEIAAASVEQSVGIEKVTEAIQQMDAAVQQNSALVEETAAASNMMDDQARSMAELVDYFSLSDNDKAFAVAPKKDVAVKPKSAFKPQQRAAMPAMKRKTAGSAPSHERTPEFALADEF